MITGRSSRQFAELVDGTATSGGDRSTAYADLVELVGALRAVPEPTPDPGFVADLRARLMTEAETVLREAADERLATEARLRLDRRPAAKASAPRRRRRAAAVITGVALAGTSASMAVAAQSALPGDGLYPLKRGIESVHAQLTFDRAARGRVLLDSASTRLDEVEQLSSSNGADAATVGDTLDAFNREAVAGADLLVQDYQATGDESSMTTLRTFTATSMARLRELEAVVPAGAVDELLQAAQALDQVEQVSVHTCSSCDGPLIGSMPSVLTQALAAAADSWHVATPTSGRPGHGRGDAPGSGVDLPQLDGQLPPASVTDPNQSGVSPTQPPSSADVQHTLQNLTGNLTGDQQQDVGSTVTDTTDNLLDAVGEVGGTLGDTVDGVTGLLPSDSPSLP